MSFFGENLFQLMSAEPSFSDLDFHFKAIKNLGVMWFVTEYYKQSQ